MGISGEGSGQKSSKKWNLGNIELQMEIKDFKMKNLGSQTRRVGLRGSWKLNVGFYTLHFLTFSFNANVLD